METQRRVELKAFEKPKENVVKPTRLAVRFEIKLEESTDQKCPELSYADLLLKHELKRKRTNSSSNSAAGNNENIFQEDEGDMEAIAKRMEEKYGKSYVGFGKGRNIDLGDGYDTEDSFIDNEEAYDELVPSSLTTKHGGFYINTGKLDFKEVSDDEIVSDQELKRKKKKKRILDSSASEVDENEPIVQRKKKKKTLSGDAMAKKSLLAAKKRKKILTSTEIGKERIKKKKLLQQKKMLAGKAQLGQTVKNNKYDSTIDAVINRNSTSTQSKAASAANQPLTTNNGEAVPKSKEVKSDPVKLPENLPEACISLIDNLKQLAAKCTDEKSKFFTPDINDLLISLDNEVRYISSIGTRNSVYSHLSSFLPINRETLMKRMKHLRQKQLVTKLHGPIENLKAAINEVMPAQIEKYKQEVQMRQASKQEDIERQKEDTQDSDEEPTPSQLPASTSSSNLTTAGAQATTSATASGTEEKKKEKATPAFRKKFEWSEKVRNCLCAVVTIKMDTYNILKTKGQSPEEFVKEFLENEVRILWPKGWMQSRVLYKESKSAHVKWTNPTQQVVPKPTVQKKPPLITNALKMAATIATNTKKSPISAGVKAGQSLLDKATVDTIAKLTVSTIQEGEKKDVQSESGLLKNISKSVAKVNKTSTESSTKAPPSSHSQSTGSSSSHQMISHPLQESPSHQTVSIHRQPFRTTESGETVVVNGKKVIGQLVTSAYPSNTTKVISTKNTDKKEPFHTKSPSIKSESCKLSTATGTLTITSRSSSDDDIKLITLPDGPTSKHTVSSLQSPIPSTSGTPVTVKQRRPNIVKQQKMVAQTQQVAATAVMQTAQVLQQQHLAASLANQKAMLHHKKVAEGLVNQQKLAKQQQIAAITAERKVASNLATQKRLIQQKAIAEQQQQQKLVQIQQQQTLVKLQQQQQAANKAQQQKIVYAQQQQKLAQSQQQKQAQIQNQLEQVQIQQQKKRVQVQQQQAAKQQLAAQQHKQKLLQAQQQQKLAQQQKELNARQQIINSHLVNQASARLTTSAHPVQFSTQSNRSPAASSRQVQPSSRSPVAATGIVTTPNSRIIPGNFAFAVAGSNRSPVSPINSSQSASSGITLWPRPPLQQQTASQMAAEYRLSLEVQKQLDAMKK